MSQPTPEERKRIVDASLNIIKRDNPDLITPPKKDELDQFMERLETATLNVRNLYKPIYQAHMDTVKPFDPKTVLLHLHNLYLEQFKTWPKDELVFACALVHAQIMKDTII